MLLSVAMTNNNGLLFSLINHNANLNAQNHKIKSEYSLFLAALYIFTKTEPKVF